MDIVFIGGFTADHTVWNNVLLSLESKQVPCNLFFIDNLGIGSESKSSYNTVEMAQAILSTLGDTIADNTCFVGHSLGGAIAQQIAILNPLKNYSLILLSSFAKLDVVGEKLLHARVSLSRAGVLKSLVADIVLPTLFSPSFLQSKEKFNFAKERFINNSQTQAGMLGQLNACLEHDTRKSLCEIKSTVKVVTGNSDMLVAPHHANYLSEKISDTEHYCLEGYGHMLPIECPEIIADIVGETATQRTELGSESLK